MMVLPLEILPIWTSRSQNPVCARISEHPWCDYSVSRQSNLLHPQVDGYHQSDHKIIQQPDPGHSQISKPCGPHSENAQRAKSNLSSKSQNISHIYRSDTQTLGNRTAVFQKAWQELPYLDFIYTHIKACQTCKYVLFGYLSAPVRQFQLFALSMTFLVQWHASNDRTSRFILISLLDIHIKTQLLQPR